MGQITDEASFIEYLKTMMGSPVVNVEVADVQFSQCIYDSVQAFQRYNYGEGNVKDALMLTLSAGVSAYKLPDEIDSVIDLQLSNNLGNINTLFSPQHTLLYNDWINGNDGLGGSSQGAAGLGGAMTVGNYYIQMMYLKEIEDIFCRKYVCDLNPNNHMLTIKPTPNLDTLGVVFVYKKEDALNLYNNVLVKKLALAKARQVHGWALSKYGLSIPGSGNIAGGESLINRGKEEEKEALEDMRLESESGWFFVG